MLKEQFLGRNPSHFQINPIVKAYIISDSLLWSAWNLSFPIFAIFVVNRIDDGNVQIAATSVSVYLIARVICELVSGKQLARSNDKEKMIIIVLGILLVSVSYIGFAVAQTISMLFAFNILAGVGLGIATPPKAALFSVHLDKNKESTEWGIADAAAFICMALATALGGFIANAYGFPILFILASIITVIATIPFVLYLK